MTDSIATILHLPIYPDLLSKLKKIARKKRQVLNVTAVSLLYEMAEKHFPNNEDIEGGVNE